MKFMRLCTGKAWSSGGNLTRALLLGNGYRHGCQKIACSPPDFLCGNVTLLLSVQTPREGTRDKTTKVVIYI